MKHIRKKFTSRLVPRKLRECASTGAVSAQTSRSLGHHLLHPQILRLLVLSIPLRRLKRSIFLCARACKEVQGPQNFQKL
jgi:hypothetical protein